MDDQVDLRPSPGRTDIQDRPRSRRRNRWVGPLIGLIVIGLVGLVAWRMLEGGRPAPRGVRQGGPPQSVGVATIAPGDVDVVLTGLGAVTPLATVTVRTQINGQLQAFGFTEGQMVHKGDFLAQIDPRPYQVALEQAQGTFAHDTALLEQAKADYARYQTLDRQDSISRQQVQDQVYLIKQYEGSVITDQAAIDSARLNLTYCHIVSPVDGRVGIRQVDPGNYVQTSDTNGLVVVTQLQPMSVLFSLPEDDIPEVQAQMAAGPLTVGAYDRTNTKLIATGTLATTDNEVDPTTGTVKLRAMFANADAALFPQQFVNARLLVRTLKGVLVAPQAAVQQGAPGDFVYLVEPNGTVHVQVVKTGVTEGDRVQIVSGLQAGDRVVTDGLDRLTDGARVVIAGAPGEGAPGEGAPGRRRPEGAGQGQGPRERGQYRRGQPPAAAPSGAQSGAQSGG
jgi:multidrug efflux system membrane fusion protein